MNTRRMDTILAIAIIMTVLPVCTQAIPMPHSVAGTVYLSDGVTQAPAGTSFNITTSEDYKEGTTGGPNSGMYVKSINGEDGDPVTVYAWNATHYGANTTTLSSDAITTMDVIIDTPFADNSPSATILHPNGGESIPIGTQVQVSAHATDDTAVTSVTFSYSNNSGSDWNSIGAGTRVSGTANDGIWNRTWNTNSLGAGSNYLIKAVADDGTSTREDQSDSTFSLTCTPPSTPTLNDPGTTDTDGSYTVAWSSVSGATSYTLEEDTSGSFGSPTVVYSGSGTSKYITGRGDGSYYYRVKACNACGCGGWSNVEDIEISMPDVGGWNKTFGGTGDDVAYSVQQTSDGGLILAGYTNSYGAGSSDFWLVKTDSSGNKQWDKTFGATESDIARSVQETSDGGYILAGCTRSYGAGSYDAWLVRINSNGDILWHAALGGTGWDMAESVQQTSDGGFIFTGYTGSYGDVFYDAWLVKVDCNGCVQWNTTFGGFGRDVAESVQQTSDGGYIIAGSTPPQGSYLFAAGFMNPLDVDFADAWLVKIDSNGNKQWDQTFGGADWDTAESVQQTSDGGFILAGYTKSYGAGDPDFWLIKTYSNGIKQWDKTFGETDDDYTYSIQQTSDGGYILTGVTEPHSDPTPVILAGFMGPCSAGGSDVWLIKTDSEGGEEWDKTFGGTDDDYASSVQETSDGGYVLAGYTKSYGAGGSDFWLIKVGGTEVPVPPTPTLNDPGTTDTDGNYTVSWSSVSGATNYTLEEATSGSFGSPTVVYSGSSTSKYITGRINGTYYYRVKACNACGCSGWSNGEDIEVKIPDSDIIRVPEDYSTIQAAVDAASSGTIIHVSVGTYIENIVIGKDDLTLEGESKNITVIDGGRTGTCVRITADNAEISGFMITNGITGVYIESSTGSIIDNNRISDHCEGVYIVNSNNNTIAHNIITDTRLCLSGIHLSSSEDNVIHDNDLSDNRDGIYIYNSNNNRIYHNNLVGNTYQAYDNTGTNHWDNGYPSGGNYWSDYTGIDTFSGADQNVLGSDGIGDTQYGISGGAGAYDRYPFMNRDGWAEEENIPPFASFTYSPLNPVVDQMVAFDLSSSYDSDGQITQHRLDFGDESGVEGPGLIGTIGYEYSSAGSYIVTLTVTDDYGAFDTETKTVIVAGSSKGDLNSDGTLTPADAAIALQLAASGGWDANADVNNDSRITSLDALMILQAAADNIEI